MKVRARVRAASVHQRSGLVGDFAVYPHITFTCLLKQLPPATQDILRSFVGMDVIIEAEPGEMHIKLVPKRKANTKRPKQTTMFGSGEEGSK